MTPKPAPLRILPLIMLMVLLAAACGTQGAALEATPAVELPTQAPPTATDHPVVPTATRLLPTASPTLPPTLVPSATPPARLCPPPWFKDNGSEFPALFFVMETYYGAYRLDWGPANDMFDLGGPLGFWVSFSHDQALVAYFKDADGANPAELWLSDVTRCQPVRYFVDEAGWFDGRDFTGNFRWSAGSKILIFGDQTNPGPMVIYQLETQEQLAWNGVCDDIIYLDATGEVVVGCAHDESYSYLHADGSITTAPVPPDDSQAPVAAWSFAYTGDVVYITAEREVRLLRSNGREVTLPLEGYADFGYFISFPLQVAAQANRFMVYADDPIGRRCPPKSGCWFVVDGETGKIIWWLKPGMLDDGHPWDEIDIMGPAALSPTGEIVAYQYLWAPLRMLLAIRVSTNEVLYVSDPFASQYMGWPAP